MCIQIVYVSRCTCVFEMCMYLNVHTKYFVKKSNSILDKKLKTRASPFYFYFLFTSLSSFFTILV